MNPEMSLETDAELNELLNQYKYVVVIIVVIIVVIVVVPHCQRCRR